MPHSRREFVKLGAGCALLVALGGSAALLQSCNVAKVYKTEAKNGEYRIPVSEFAVDKMRLLRVPGMDFDILVVKKTETVYNALYLECTHRQYPLTVNARGLNCPSHGSAFNLDGKVTNGPASAPLKKFATHIDGKDLVIKA
jgi:Rieske Fe-S protein